MPPWSAKVIVDTKIVEQLLNSQFPQISIETLELVGNGWDNTVFLVNDTWIFRFPRREEAVELLLTENKALPLFADKLNIVIPKPKFFGEPSKDFCWPFSGYKFIDGQAAYLMNLTREERSALAEPLALFLRQLHQLPVDTQIKAVLRNDPIARLNVKNIKKRLANYSTLVKDSSLDDYKSAIDFALSSCQDLEFDKKERVIHGDLYSRHIILDSKKQISGIIDWGDTMIDEPTIDLSIAHSFLPRQAHQCFRSHYGHISDSDWLLARLRAVSYGVSLTSFGYDTGDRAVHQEGLNILALIKEGL